MLYWAAIFFALAIIAAIFGFGGLAGTLSWVAQALFLGFIVLMLASAVTHAVRGASA